MAEVNDRTFSIIPLVLDSGERLPCLVDSDTWIPLHLATRWAVRYRRYHVQSSTLTANLRAIAKLYEWAWYIGRFDLDDFLTSGQLLNARHLDSLAHYLRGADKRVKANTLNGRLIAIENFLVWLLAVENRGGSNPLSIEQLAAERMRLEVIFSELRIKGNHSVRIQPLSNEEITAIRKSIGPQKKESWVFSGCFSKHTALRNWLMFETALELGIRRGELLKLRLDSLPRGSKDGIKVKRFPDDPNDSRSVEPAVKTSERIIPASRGLLSAMRMYITQPPPLGRQKNTSPYLFLTRSGKPVSIDTSNDIVRAISQHSDVSNLSWHRFRHTWAERMALELSDRPNGVDILMYLGGWSDMRSPLTYIQDAVAKQADVFMREYQEGLYTLEVE